VVIVRLLRFGLGLTGDSSEEKDDDEMKNQNEFQQTKSIEIDLWFSINHLSTKVHSFTF
jgi:hypothetical protein